MVKTLLTLNYNNEQIRLLLNAKSGSFGANLIVPLAFFFIYKNLMPLYMIVTWTAMHIFIFIIRMYFAKKALKILDTSDKQTMYKYLKLYLYVIFANSFLWGVVSILVISYTDQFHIIFYFVFILGLSSAAISTLAMVFHAVFIFSINSIGISILSLIFIGGTQIYYILSFMLFAYLTIILMASYKNYVFMRDNIKQREEIKKSIDYAALIQQSILPDAKKFGNFCKDSFILWQPKDTVGGDIYFMTQLSDDEILIMVIDSAGHGVPGAFLTMLVKAIEERIIADIKNVQLEPSPSLILGYFNKSIKTMLKQEKGSRSNVGFDGGVLYYNKETNICKYAGAKTPLYIINNGILKVIESDRKNVGFARTKINQKYTEYDVDIKEGTKLYIATDGITNQEGADETRYGKNKFKDLILKNCNKLFEKQKESITNSFTEFKREFDQSDDVTVMGLEFKVVRHNIN